MLVDEITEHHINRVKHYNAVDLLTLDVPKKTELIIEGRWTLSNKDKNEAICNYYGLTYANIINEFEKFNVDEDFLKVLYSSYLKEDIHKLNDIIHPSLSDIISVYSTDAFKLINISETKDDKKISRDINGIPLIDDLGNMIMIPKLPGEIIWSSNKGNINNFINSYKSAFGKDFYNPYASNTLSAVMSRLPKDFINREVFKLDLHLYISSNPQDILNQSMSEYYQSCQTLYREEKGFKDMKPMMANLFDKNTKICYLMFDTPWTDHHGETYPFTAFSRMFIRLVNDKPFFDYVYPASMTTYLRNITTKCTDMKNVTYSGEYKYSTPHEYAQHTYLDILKPKWTKE